jgi:hypothetical protein
LIIEIWKAREYKVKNSIKTNAYIMKTLDHIEKMGKQRNRPYNVVSKDIMFKMDCAKQLFRQINRF